MPGHCGRSKRGEKYGQSHYLRLKDKLLFGMRGGAVGVVRVSFGTLAAADITSSRLLMLQNVQTLAEAQQHSMRRSLQQQQVVVYMTHIT
ncbi:hypothetical protein J6590_024903 [Homalodisca vitripennis]|nr:hypothetical protein J6590_024903 [Homalodisca vitripennis]